MEKFEVQNGKLIFPQGITKLDKESYHDYNTRHDSIARESVTTVVIPESVIEIGDYAFDGFKGLKSLLIPHSVKSIGESAFRDCVSLKELFIPASVETIADDAFFCCSALESIVVEEGSKNYDSRDNCNAIIETATNKLIQGCNTTVIPSTVEEISHSAFMNCSTLKEIIIPESVQSVGDAAFMNCVNLEKMKIMNPHVQIGANAFYGTPYAEEYNPVYLSKREQRGKKSRWYEYLNKG